MTLSYNQTTRAQIKRTASDIEHILAETHISKFVTNQLYQLFKDKHDLAGTLKCDEQGICHWHLPLKQYDVSLRCSSPDRHSTELLELQVVSVQRDEEADTRSLQELADTAIHHLGYLEEPLQVCELSEPDRTVQLRSTPPQHDNEALFYWELLIQQTRTTAETKTTTRLSRYHWHPGMIERDVVHYPATFVLIGRLSESLTLEQHEQ